MEPSKVNYVQFSKDLESVFGPDGLEQDPLAEPMQTTFPQAFETLGLASTTQTDESFGAILSAIGAQVKATSVAWCRYSQGPLTG